MAQFTNQASISYNGLTANSNIVTGEITRVLSVSKTSVSGSYRRGDTLTYAVSISNTGSAPYTGLTVTDDLGAYTAGTASVTPLTFAGDSVLYYVNGVLQAAPTVAAGPPLTISGISVPAGGNALIVYRAAANDYAAPGTGGSIVNTASVSGGGLTEPISASETVTADTSEHNQGAESDGSCRERADSVHLHYPQHRRGGRRCRSRPRCKRYL